MDWNKLFKNPLAAVVISLFIALAWPLVSVFECWENDLRKSKGTVDKGIICLLSAYALVVSVIGVAVVMFYLGSRIHDLSVYLSP